MTEKKAATDPAQEAPVKRDADVPDAEAARTPEEEEALRERLQRKAEAARIVVVHAKD